MENIKASFRFNSLAHLTGTIRVYPREIEEVMYQIPQIRHSGRSGAESRARSEALALSRKDLASIGFSHSQKWSDVGMYNSAGVRSNPNIRNAIPWVIDYKQKIRITAFFSTDNRPRTTDIERFYSSGVLLSCRSLNTTSGNTNEWDCSIFYILKIFMWYQNLSIHIGDSIHLEQVVKQLCSSSSGNRAILKFEKEVINQKNEVVQTGTTTILLAKRASKKTNIEYRRKEWNRYCSL